MTESHHIYASCGLCKERKWIQIVVDTFRMDDRHINSGSTECPNWSMLFKAEIFGKIIGMVSTRLSMIINDSEDETWPNP